MIDVDIGGDSIGNVTTSAQAPLWLHDYSDRLHENSSKIE